MSNACHVTNKLTIYVQLTHAVLECHVRNLTLNKKFFFKQRFCIFLQYCMLKKEKKTSTGFPHYMEEIGTEKMLSYNKYTYKKTRDDC